MMVSTPEETTGASRIIVRDEIGPLAIVGWKVAALSWSYDEAWERGHNRWTDMMLYAVQDDPDMKYAVQILGRSAVYHRPNSTCGQGVGVLVSKIREDQPRYNALVACPKCKPEDLDDLTKAGDSVQVEVDLPKLYRCRDANEVVTSLYSHGVKDGRSQSGLSVRILRAAAMVDGDIEQALMNMRRT